MTAGGPHEGPTVVLGVGNPLLADDGAGLVLLERLRARRWPEPMPEFVPDDTDPAPDEGPVPDLEA